MSSNFRFSDLAIKILVGLELPTRHPHIKRIIPINRIEIIFTRILAAYATHPFYPNMNIKHQHQYDDLFKIQQQILYIFSRYMRANPPGSGWWGWDEMRWRCGMRMCDICLDE